MAERQRSQQARGDNEMLVLNGIFVGIKWNSGRCAALKGTERKDQHSASIDVEVEVGRKRPSTFTITWAKYDHSGPVAAWGRVHVVNTEGQDAIETFDRFAFSSSAGMQQSENLLLSEGFDFVLPDVASVRSVRLELYRLADRAASKLPACRTVLCATDRALLEKYLLDDFCNRDAPWSTFTFIFRHVHVDMARLPGQLKRKSGNMSPISLSSGSERNAVQGSRKRHAGQKLHDGLSKPAELPAIRRPQADSRPFSIPNASDVGTTSEEERTGHHAANIVRSLIAEWEELETLRKKTDARERELASELAEAVAAIKCNEQKGRIHKMEKLIGSSTANHTE